MSLNRWKVLACTLTVGVGGLAVFATPPSADKAEAPKDPAPLPTLTVKPPSSPAGTDTPAPTKPMTAAEFDLVVPDPVVTPAAAEPAKKAASEPVFEPLTPAVPGIVPAGATDVKDPPKPDGKKKPDADKPADLTIPPLPMPDAKETTKPVAPVPDIPKVEGPKPAPADAPPLPPAVKVETPPPPFAAPAAPARPEAPPAAAPQVKPDPAPATAPEPFKSVSAPPPVTPPPATTPVPPGPTPTRAGATPSARLKMLVRMGDGQPRFEIRNSATTELLLKVYGEKIEMQAPPEAKWSLAGVTALGRVRFTAPGLEGTCDHLTILSGTGEVLLKGNIHLKSKRGKAWSELTAEKMVYQIGTAGLSAGAPSPVRPASYIPD